MRKNVAGQFVGAQMNSKTDGSALTTGTTTVYVTGDAGTQAAGSVGSGACAHEGQGFWTYAPAQAETNYDHVAFTFTHTSAVHATVQIYPSFPQTGDNFARLGAPAGASVSADVAAVKVDTAAILVDTGTTLDARIPAALVSGRMDSSVGAMAANVLTATAINADAITAAKVAADVSAEIADAVWDEDATAHQTQGTFGQAIGDPVADTNTIFKAVVTDAAGATVGVDVVAVKSDTAAILIDTAEIGAAGAGLTAIDLPDQTMNITGNLSGSVGSVTGAVGSVTAAVTVGTINANVVNASALAADAVAEIADGVWDEDATGHQTQGTFGQAIGDPVADTNTIYKAVVTDAAGATVGVDVVAVKAETASIQTDTNDIQTRLPAALVSGRIDASVGAMAAGVLTATAIAADAITDAKVAADVTIASVTGAVGSVTGAVGSVTGNVGGNVTGSVGSVATGGIVAGSFAAGAIDAAAIAADAIGSSELAASAVTEIQTGLATSAALAIVQAVTDKLEGMTELGVGSPTYYRWEATALELAPTGGSAPTAATIADAVWDEARAGHVAGGSFGEGVASVQGNVTGSVGSVTGAVGSVGAGGITAASFAADAITAAKIAADVTTELQAGLATSAALATAQTDLDDIQTRLPAALVSGRMDASVGAMAAGVITATSIAADAITDAKVAADVTIASVTGAVGSVTGNVGGNVTGSVGSIATGGIVAGSFAAGAIDAAAIAANAIGASELAADAATEIAAAVRVDLTTELGRIDVATSTRASQTSVDTLDNFVDTEVDAIKVVTDKLAGMIELGVGSPTYYRYNTPALELAPTGGSAPSAGTIADAVWDELLAGHAIGGSAGAALSAAGTAGDPWLTALPGAYGAGTAGKIVGDNINATISSRATQTSVDTIDGIVDNILIDTAEIGAAGAGLTALGDARISNLDATISSRTKPADTQAAVTTVTNLTNAATAGDFTAVMKTSLNAATPASIVGAVGSVTGGVTVTTNNDKTGYRLSATGVDDVWDEAIAGHLAAGSTGLALNDATAAGNPWNSVLEGALTAGDLLRIQAGVAVGKTTIVAPGNGTAHVEFRDASDLSLIVAADMTGSERTAVALTP